MLFLTLKSWPSGGSAWLGMVCIHSSNVVLGGQRQEGQELKVILGHIVAGKDQRLFKKHTVLVCAQYLAGRGQGHKFQVSCTQ